MSEQIRKEYQQAKKLLKEYAEKNGEKFSEVNEFVLSVVDPYNAKLPLEVAQLYIVEVNSMVK